MAEGQRGGATTRPDYTAKLVDELPPKIARGRTGPRPDPDFLAGLQLAVAHPGTWAELGHYRSENGARTMDKRIEDRELDDFIPSGKWEFDWRRVTPWEGPLKDTKGKPIRWSIFYGRWHGDNDNETDV